MVIHLVYKLRLLIEKEAIGRQYGLATEAAIKA
jgi:hypothetical protein